MDDSVKTQNIQKCAFCGAELSPGAKFCSQCSNPTSKKKAGCLKNFIVILLAVFAVIVVLFAILIRAAVSSLDDPTQPSETESMPSGSTQPNTVMDDSQLASTIEAIIKTSFEKEAVPFCSVKSDGEIITVLMQIDGASTLAASVVKNGDAEDWDSLLKFASEFSVVLSDMPEKFEHSGLTVELIIISEIDSETHLVTAQDGEIMFDLVSASQEDIPYEHRAALAKAQRYSDNMHMSKADIFDQLTSEYGEQFPEEAAQYAVDNVDADWNYNALKSAESYSENMHMSKMDIYDQLVSEYGAQFTAEEAQYAIDHIVADWNYNALQTAKSYQKMNMSLADIHDQLTSEHGAQFTEKEADYAIAHIDD